MMSTLPVSQSGISERTVSGNVERTPDGRYRLTDQRRSFMTTARTMSRLFGGDPRFVGDRPPSPNK